jgi:glucokinase
MLTLGTGLGGGIVLEGKIYSGADNTAGEFGHMVIDPAGPLCGCGRKGCLETFASATALTRAAREALRRGAKSLILKMAGGKAEGVTSAIIHQAMRRGDPLAKKVWSDMARALGTGIANLVNVFNPDLVVLGGGLILAGNDLLQPVRAEVRRSAFERPAKTARIVLSRLGGDAGVIGAAVMGLVRDGVRLG